MSPGQRPQSAQPASPANEPEPEPGQTTGPVGAGEHVVRPGDCISSIAKVTGHFWEVIWNDSANAELKAAREDPNVLLPDDRVTIPPLRAKKEPGETEVRHRFVRKGEPALLRLQVLDDRRPIANEPYELRIDQDVYNGNTDPEGKLEVPIPGNAQRAYLVVGTEPEVYKYTLNLGEVDPVETLKGIQQRLRNLGYVSVPVDGMHGPETEACLRLFQKDCELTPTGRVDQQTRDALKQKHGC